MNGFITELCTYFTCLFNLTGHVPATGRHVSMHCYNYVTYVVRTFKCDILKYNLLYILINLIWLTDMALKF